MSAFCCCPHGRRQRQRRHSLSSQNDSTPTQADEKNQRNIIDIEILVKVWKPQQQAFSDDDESILFWVRKDAANAKVRNKVYRKMVAAAASNRNSTAPDAVPTGIVSTSSGMKEPQTNWCQAFLFLSKTQFIAILKALPCHHTLYMWLWICCWKFKLSRTPVAAMEAKTILTICYTEKSLLTDQSIGKQWNGFQCELLENTPLGDHLARVLQLLLRVKGVLL